MTPPRVPAVFLISHPGELARLRQEPELLESGVEELLRFAGPAETATERYATDDVVIAGVHIPKGEMVLAVLASANRDAAKFDRPDVLDVARANNRHVAFGLGLHHCLGASLTRMEARVAIGALVARAPRLRLRVPREQLRWRPGSSCADSSLCPFRSEPKREFHTREPSIAHAAENA